MEITKLNEVLKSQAANLNACEKGLSGMNKVLSKDELITLWKQFFDFAIEKNFPSIEFIKENFEPDVLHRNFVYVDEDILATNNNGIVVANGRCKGTLMYNSFGCATIYIRHLSDVTISAKGFSVLFVHTYDSSKVHIIQDDMSKVYIYQHDYSEETHEGEVIFRKK